MQSPSRRLGEFLVERKVLSRDALEDALIREERDGVPLAKLLIGEGLVGERDLVAGLAYQLGIPFLDFEQQPVNPQLERLVPVELARRHVAVAVSTDGSNLTVAMEDPTDTAAVKEISDAIGWSILPVLAVRADLKRVIAWMYGPDAADQLDGDSAATALGPPVEFGEAA